MFPITHRRARARRSWAAAILCAVAAPGAPPLLAAQAPGDAARRCAAAPPGDRAVAACREALRLAPTDLGARRSLAAAHAANGDYEAALEEYREITRREPGSARAQLDLATTLDRLGKSDDALQAYRRYLELDPGEPRAHELVGWLLVQRGRVAEALTEFRSAQRLAPERAAAYHGAGVALAVLGRREEALRALQAAARLSPDDATIWGETANTAADLGRTTDALSAWDRALRLDPGYFDGRPEERKRWEALAAKAPAQGASTAAPRNGPLGDAASRRAPAGASGPATPRSATGIIKRSGPDASGSGFAITTDGYVVTNRHVVTACRSLAVRADSGLARPATIVAVHPKDDVAVIRADGAFELVASFRVGSPIRPGDDVVAVGFPLAGLLADEPNVTTGSVSAMAGIHNDPSLLQMSAPVQQGSSGGPLFDAGGHVVGVVVTKLNARVVAEETGDLPQNVNFALKAEIARAFLDEAGIPYATATSETRLSNADVGEIGRGVTVMVECYR